MLAYVDDDGYPMEVATGFRTEGDCCCWMSRRATCRRRMAHGSMFSSATSDPCEVTATTSVATSRYGGRCGTATGCYRRAGASQSWDERDVPFFEYSERSVPQAHRYFRDLGKLQDREVRPKLAGFWLFLRATRLPFLTATFVPVALGVAAAASNGAFDLWLALLTLLGAVFIHLGLNVTNDVFDTLSGADAANSTPTPFSGGSRSSTTAWSACGPCR